MDAMPRVGAGKLLDPMKAIDVVQYALLMGDPLRPGEIPSWFCCSVERQSTHVPEQAQRNYINRNHEQVSRRQQDPD